MGKYSGEWRPLALLYITPYCCVATHLHRSSHYGCCRANWHQTGGLKNSIMRPISLFVCLFVTLQSFFDSGINRSGPVYFVPLFMSMASIQTFAFKYGVPINIWHQNCHVYADISLIKSGSGCTVALKPLGLEPSCMAHYRVCWSVKKLPISTYYLLSVSTATISASTLAHDHCATAPSRR